MLTVSYLLLYSVYPHTQNKDSDDEDELKYADDVDMPGQKFETKQRITVRNLRIREDTAKVCIIVLHALLITSITVFYVCMIYTSDIRYA